MSETGSKTSATIDPKLIELEEAIEAWRPFATLRAEVDRLFDHFGPDLRAPASRTDAAEPVSLTLVGHRPAVDLVDRGARYVVAIDLPGMTEADVEATVVNGVLIVRGETRDSREDRAQAFVFRERRFGRFERRIPLPQDVDAGAIEASFANGVLTIDLPKAAKVAAPSTKIHIKAA